MRKKLLFVLCITGMLLVLAGCKNKTRPSCMVASIPVDNQINILDMGINTYTLAELDTFFNKYTELNDDRSQKDLSNELTIEAVQKRFPIAYFRECTVERFEIVKDFYYYCMYKVEEGGNYYVFWKLDGYPERLYFDSIVYIDKAPSLWDTFAVLPGENTYQDVKKLLSGTKLELVEHEYVMSYTRLTNDLLYVAEYGYITEDYDSATIAAMPVQRDYFVQISDSNSDLALIQKEDLPGLENWKQRRSITILIAVVIAVAVIGGMVAAIRIIREPRKQNNC